MVLQFLALLNEGQPHCYLGQKRISNYRKLESISILIDCPQFNHKIRLERGVWIATRGSNREMQKFTQHVTQQVQHP